MLVDDVATNAVGRADVVLGAEVGKSAAEVVEQAGISVGDGDACGTALPDSHEPDGVEAVGGDGVPFGWWD